MNVTLIGNVSAKCSLRVTFSATVSSPAAGTTTGMMQFFFFFQAEDGIRDRNVTGVQTYALPILLGQPNFQLVQDSVENESTVNVLMAACDAVFHLAAAVGVQLVVDQPVRSIRTTIHGTEVEIGRASCRERVWGRGGQGAG